jgi:guanylate kinase
MTRNKIIIISGPVAVGKTTVAKIIMKKMPYLQKAVSFTTRKKRAGTAEDKIMKYVTVPEFQKKIQRGDFIEWAIVHDQYYGTDKNVLANLLKKGPVLLNIDTQGALILKKKLANIVLIFIRPESLEILKKRLIKRSKGKVDQKDFQIRINNVKRELKYTRYYDYQVVNKEGQLAKTLNQVAKIIKNELKS